MRRMRIGMAQINATVGDFAGNAKKILDAIADARTLGVDLLAFSELTICVYPPEDLLPINSKTSTKLHDYLNPLGEC